MQNKSLVFIVGVFVGAVISFMLAPGRYQIVVHGVGVASRLDTATGAIELCKLGEGYVYSCPATKK